VALLDHQMPGMDGAQVAAVVLRDELPTRVLLVSANVDAAIVYHALQQGAAGYLPKESSRAEIVQAVIDCAEGRDVVAPQLAAGLASEIRRRAEPSGPTLSAREREVLARAHLRGHCLPIVDAPLQPIQRIPISHPHLTQPARRQQPPCHRRPLITLRRRHLGQQPRLTQRIEHTFDTRTRH